MADSTNKLLPVIMSGGSGMRLWPLSRKAMPKQFHVVTGDKGTLLQRTLERVQGDMFAPPLIVCHEDHRFIAQENAASGQYPLSGIILEPESRNTAATVIISALWAQRSGFSHILILPSDHMIEDTTSFQNDVNAALNAFNEKNAIAYFGIKPTHPHTGYGYIIPDKNGNVTAFHEKPDATTAQKLIVDSGALWNSGMFLIAVDALLTEMRTLDNNFVSTADIALAKAQSDLSFLRLPKDEYIQLPSLPFDKAYCEKTNSGKIITAGFSWNDIGSWESVHENSDRNSLNTVLRGNVIAEDTHNSYISSDGILVGVTGMDNAVIVATKDAILVSSKDKTQNVRTLVDAMKTKGIKQADEYFIVYRPWGSYEILNETPGCRIIRMRINPHGKLSLQSHTLRTEHWVVVSGSLTVTKYDKKQVLVTGESDFAHAGEKHRLENTGDTIVEFIEVQTGIINDDDIERFDQVY